MLNKIKKFLTRKPSSETTIISIIAAIVITALVILLTPKNTGSLTKFKLQIARQAIKQGASEYIIKTKLMPAKINYRSKQIKHSISKKHPPKIEFSSYYHSIMRRANKERLLSLYNKHKHTLEEIQRRYKVPLGYLLGIWCTESNFGRHIGKMKIIPSLLTLAYLHPSRRKFFSEQLIAALVIFSRNPKINPKAYISTFDGGMGQTQLEPSSYINYAAKFNPHNRKKYSDVWDNPKDALASAANYLHKKGWDSKNPRWGIAVKLSAAKYWQELIDKNIKLPISAWIKLGVKGIPKDVKANTIAKIISPDNINKNVFLVFKNYNTLLKWNPRPQEAIAIGSIYDKTRDII